jgi:muramoyltetrapeptide carboxypeptidase
VGPIKPPALKPGDTIAIVAPATAVSPNEMRTAVSALKRRGFKVIQYARTDTHQSHYLSDTDASRAQAINRAFANPKVKAVFSIQGGGGSFRPDFLNRLDWDLIRANPKIFTGFSDITFLHHAIQSQTGLVTFHAGFPAADPALSPNTKLFWEMVSPKRPGLIPPPIRAGKNYQCLVPGEITGKLVGGNLSLVSATIGTPYQLPMKEKEILFLEDWKLDYECVDRLISHLGHSGFWDRIEGLILGEFHYVPRKSGDFGLKRDQVIADIVREARRRKIPVGFNFPIGHGQNNRPLPMGVQVHFDSKNGVLTFLESPVST